MTRPVSCPREEDVLDLVWTNRWPSRASVELREHAAACPTCRDLANVAVAIGDLDEQSRTEVKVPDASLVWYRAQVRARQAQARRAARPVVAAEAVAALCLVGGVIAAWDSGGRWLADWWRTLPAFPALRLPVWSDLVPAVDSSTWAWVMAAAGLWTVMVPAAFYVARMADRTPHSPGGRLTAPTRDRRTDQ